MNFTAEDVERLTLSQSGYTYTVEVTEKEDLQAVIDMVNSFQHTGNELKHGFLFGSNSGEQPVSDTARL